MRFYQMLQRKENTTISENTALLEEASNSLTSEETLIPSRLSVDSSKTKALALRMRMIFSHIIIFSDASEADLTGDSADILIETLTISIILAHLVILGAVLISNSQVLPHHPQGGRQQLQLKV